MKNYPDQIKEALRKKGYFNLTPKERIESNKECFEALLRTGEEVSDSYAQGYRDGYAAGYASAVNQKHDKSCIGLTEYLP